MVVVVVCVCVGGGLVRTASHMSEVKQQTPHLKFARFLEREWCSLASSSLWGALSTSIAVTRVHKCSPAAPLCATAGLVTASIRSIRPILQGALHNPLQCATVLVPSFHNGSLS
jgi:hypothetical protein